MSVKKVNSRVSRIKAAQIPDDDYGFKYGTTHLAYAGFKGRQRLYQMTDCNWRQQLRSRLRTNYRFLADLERGWQALRISPAAIRKELPVLACQLGLMHGFVEDAMSKVSNETLELMVRLGMPQQAFYKVCLREKPVSRRRAAAEQFLRTGR